MGNGRLAAQLAKSNLFAPRGNLDGAERSSDFADSRQFIGLDIAGDEFMLPIEVMNEILMINELTFVPGAKTYIEGVLNLRGKIIPAINIRQMMGHKTIAPTGGSRIIITHMEDTICGLIVDGITYVLALHPAQIEERSLSQNAGTDILSGICKRGDKINGIIDLSKILANVMGDEVDEEDD